jgi:predicted lipoprotein with Yx(FWY)xxD motif
VVIQAVDHPQFGQILVTADGRTLYSNTADSVDQIVCANSDCTSFWPPYIVAAQPAAVEGIPGALGTVTRPDGTLQLTYNQNRSTPSTSTRQRAMRKGMASSTWAAPGV